MKRLWFLFVHFPDLVIIAWKTRKIDNEITIGLRSYLAWLFMCVLLFIISFSHLKSGFRENQNRIDAANVALQKFPALTKINDSMQECFGSPYSLLILRFTWIECDLEAFEMSSKQGLGYQYTQFAAERNYLLENAGVKIYPRLDMPPPLPRNKPDS
jgi:hypothetical protein